MTGLWFHPISKICASQMGSFPPNIQGENKISGWNHHLDEISAGNYSETRQHFSRNRIAHVAQTQGWQGFHHGPRRAVHFLKILCIPEFNNGWRAPKWWALESWWLRLKMWPFLVSMLDFWGVVETLFIALYDGESWIFPAISHSQLFPPNYQRISWNIVVKFAPQMDFGST